MTKTAHRIFIGLLVVVVFITLIALIYNGLAYYNLSLGERVYHHDHEVLKPSGLVGHGLGIIGTFLIIVGVTTYMLRKRYRIFSRIGLLKHWLEFHIFLCTLGPIMVLFHTAFKFGGLVAISFWSMVAVFLSGIVGRFIYLQIPRSIGGITLNLDEVRAMRSDVAGMVKSLENIDDNTFAIIEDSVKRKSGLYHRNPIIRYLKGRSEDRKTLRRVKGVLRRSNLRKEEYRKIVSHVKNDITLNRRMEMLDTMLSLFKYWHVAHLPFAMVMLIIMIIHVGVTILFGYRWIF